MTSRDRSIVSEKTKKKRNLSLTKKGLQKMWGDGGPYSEVYLIIETRILDDQVTRLFLEVQASINPLTFEMVRKNRRFFSDNKRIRDILEYSEYSQDEGGYKAHLFSVPYERDILEVANQVLKETEDAIIKMHKFVMNQFDIDVN